MDAYRVVLPGAAAPDDVIGPPGRILDLQLWWSFTTDLGADAPEFDGVRNYVGRDAHLLLRSNGVLREPVITPLPVEKNLLAFPNASTEPATPTDWPFPLR